MRRRACHVVMLVSCLVLLFSVAFAASYDGAIWTGKPNSLGIGYYCTAAQNRSQGDASTHWAKAKTWASGVSSPIVASVTGNKRAVASTCNHKPYKGWGSYGETGWSTSGSFGSSAWN